MFCPGGHFNQVEEERQEHYIHPIQGRSMYARWVFCRQTVGPAKYVSNWYSKGWTIKFVQQNMSQIGTQKAGQSVCPAKSVSNRLATQKAGQTVCPPKSVSNWYSKGWTICLSSKICIELVLKRLDKRFVQQNFLSNCYSKGWTSNLSMYVDKMDEQILMGTICHLKHAEQ